MAASDIEAPAPQSFEMVIKLDSKTRGPHPDQDGKIFDVEKSATRSAQTGNAPIAPETSEVFEALVAQEEGRDIKFRTMSWQRCAVLLFGDQVCLAIMAQAWTLKVLGWVPGLLVQFFSGVLFWVTSYTMWQ